MTSDRVNDLFRMQHALQTGTYKVDFENMSDEERIQFIRMNVLAITDELHEALNETGWKPWASSRHMNVDGYMSELVDVFHFFMNLMLATGYRPDDLAEMLYEGYFDKRKKNIARQEAGYDGITGKCPGCKRAYDDKGVRCSPMAEPASVYSWCDDKKEYVK